MFGIGQRPTTAIRATVLQIDNDGTAIAKPMQYPPPRIWQPIIIPRRSVRQLGLQSGEMVDLAIDEAVHIRRISKVFG